MLRSIGIDGLRKRPDGSSSLDPSYDALPRPVTSVSCSTTDDKVDDVPLGATAGALPPLAAAAALRQKPPSLGDGTVGGVPSASSVVVANVDELPRAGDREPDVRLAPPMPFADVAAFANAPPDSRA